jgi:fermentation-respiration switch protein FrsA (DUF1100 family)
VSPFSSWKSIAHEHAPVLGPLLVRSGSDPATEVTKLGTRPLLIIHGDQDDIVSLANGRRVLKRAKDAGVEASMATIAGAGHNDVMEHDESREALATFLDSRWLGSGHHHPLPGQGQNDLPF